jgi:hypothetical protein
LGLSVRLEEISGGLDGPIDVLGGVLSREEEGFELAAGHIDPALDQAPEVFGKEFSVGAIGSGPIDDWVRVKEKRHHATDALHLGIDPVIASGRKESIAESFAECFKVTRNIAFARGVAYQTDRDDPVATCAAAFMLRTRSQHGKPVTEAGGS